MRRLAIGTAAFALLLAACGAASEQLSEKLTEEIIEQSEGVDDIDIDFDSGKVSIENDDGSSIVIGGGEVPDDFGIPLPDGYEVTAVFASDESSSVTLRYPGADFDNLVAYYDEWTSGQAEEWSHSNSSFETDEDQTLMTASWTMDGGSSYISITNLCISMTDGDADEWSAICVTVVE